MIGLTPPGEGVGVVGPGNKKRKLLEGGSPPGTHNRGKLVRVDQDLVVPIVIQVQHLDSNLFSCPELALRLGQIPPDGLPEVGQIETAEDTMPVRIVALGPADGPPGAGWVSSLTTQSR